MFSVKGKKAIVTGGGRGIGRAMAEGLLEQGAQVVIMGSNDRILEVADSMGNRQVKGVICDFDISEAIEAAFAEALDFLGGEVDILINNAGMQIRHKNEDFPLEDWEKIIRVNMTSVFLMTQLAGREMLKKGYGKIINIASMLSFTGGHNVVAYAASKGGVAQVTKSFANAWASRGINVNAIAPGYIATDNTAAIREDELRNQEILSRIPTGHWGEPKDMVGAMIFLASSASDYLNGAIIPVDGGFLSK